MLELHIHLGLLCMEQRKTMHLEEIVSWRDMFTPLFFKDVTSTWIAFTCRWDAGEVDDLWEREKSWVDDAEVWSRTLLNVDENIRLGAIAFGLGTLIYTGLEFVHFFEVISTTSFPPTFPGSYGLQFVAHPLRHQPGAPHDLHLHADVLPLHALQAQHQQEQDHRKVWTDAPLSRVLVVKLSLAKLLFHRQQTAVFGSELLSGKNRKKVCHWKWNKENWSVLSN